MNRLVRAAQEVIDAFDRGEIRANMSASSKLLALRICLNSQADSTQVLKCVDASKTGGELVEGQVYQIAAEGHDHYRIAVGGRKWAKRRFVLTTLSAL